MTGIRRDKSRDCLIRSISRNHPGLDWLCACAGGGSSPPGSVSYKLDKRSKTKTDLFYCMEGQRAPEVPPIIRQVD